MKTSNKHALYLATALTAVSLAATPAFAQDEAEGSSGGGLDEIVVTAQRQSESLMEVPLSIQALSGDQLSEQGIRQMSDLQLTTPGFVPSNSSGYNQMFIRGVGNAIFVGADPSVATFIDDVPRVFGTLVNNFVDVERVEVIKGAPGALYGRNATGGAVNIITRQPDPEAVHAKFRLSYGEKATLQLGGYINLPLGEKAAMSVAVQRSKHDPYIKNITRDANPYTASNFPVNNVAGPGTASFLGTPQQTADFFNSYLISRKGYNREDFWAVSGKVLFKPSDTFKITIAGDWSEKDDDNGNGAYNTIPGYPVAVLSGFMNSFAGASTSVESLANFIVPVTEDFATAQRADGFVKLEDYGASATAVLSLDAVDITSITSYRENKSRFLTELGFTPFSMIQAYVPLNKSTFYQELRAVSANDGPLQYIVGASYMRSKLSGGLFSNLIPPLVLNAPAGSGGYVTKNWSAYAQLSYDLTEQLNLMVSGRYIHETNDAHSINPLTGTDDPFTLKEKKFLPSATLKYNLAGGGNVYARWARGFKAGGIVPVTPVTIFPDPFTQGGIFKGETIDTFEVGFRAPLMDNRVNVTAAIFYNDYKDVQVGAHARIEYQALASISVVNAGSARTYGAEASITAKVADPLTIGVNAGYLNAKYKTFQVLNNPVLEDFDLSGTRMINSPEWQLSANANLDAPVSDDWRIVGNAVVSYTDDVLWQQSGLPGFLPDAVGPSYVLVNARLGVKSADDKIELAVYAKNLFNEGYTTFGGSTATYGNILIWGDPRIVGAEAIFNF
ncbi:MAG: TonB-dependent receptor [Novosphingobium sp.]|nr:TonB-dependent receptor [Novosphingobium sp.]